MAQNLWGEELDEFDLQRMPRRTLETTIYTPAHCQCYGHAWEYFGIIGLKRCSVCQIKGYCPLCTPTPPLPTAQPFTVRSTHQLLKAR